MPRPVLIAFALGVLVSIGALLWAFLLPASQTVALQLRRPPPRGNFTHDAGTVVPGPLPSVIPTIAAPCDAVARTKIIGGGDALVKIATALQGICRFVGGGVPANMSVAIGGLDGATIRFGGFGRTGVESTADIASRTIWLNLKFALHSTPAISLAPVIVHEAWHLASTDEPENATAELNARAAEVGTCRQLIPIDKWPRWCHDADALTSMDPARALALLVSAGYLA